jgi:hypothetical protein
LQLVESAADGAAHVVAGASAQPQSRCLARTAGCGKPVPYHVPWVVYGSGAFTPDYGQVIRTDVDTV